MKSLILPIMRSAASLTSRGAGLFFDAVTARPAVQRPDGSIRQLAFTTDVTGSSGAPTTATYLVQTADAGLSAERVVTDSATISAVWATPGQVTFVRAAITGDVTIAVGANTAEVTDLTITGETRGDLLTRGAASWGRLAPGTSGYALLSAGAGADLVWGAVQPLDATLTAWAAAGSQGLPYFSATDTVSTLTLAADQGIYATGASTLATFDLTSAGRALVDDANATAQRTTLGILINFPQYVGTTSYYLAAHVSGGNYIAGGNLAANTYKAVPWLCPRTGTIDQLAIDVVTSAAASSVVAAMWSDSSGAPGTVLGQFTTAATSTGLKTSGVSINVTEGTLYWFTCLNSVAAVQLRTGASGDWFPTFGHAGGASDAQIMLSVAQAYTSPTPAWPGGATIATVATSRIGVFIRWSA